MRLSKALRNLIIPLPEERAVATGVSRDETRTTRARLAELSLKMHADSLRRGSGPSQ